MPTTTRNRILPAADVLDRPARRTMLAPVAYSDVVMPSMQLARSSRLARRIATWLFCALGFTIVLMLFAPWQQSITGSGFVMAYSPRERPQVVQAPVSGRITKWGENLMENSRVAEGDLIAEIEDLDPFYQITLDQQLKNAELTWEASKNEVAAAQRELEFITKVVASTEEQLSLYRRVREEVVGAQDAYVEMAMRKVDAENQELMVNQAAEPQIQAAYDRARILYDQQNISLERLQEIERRLLEAQGKVRKAQAYVESAEAELKGKKRDREAYIQKADAEIQKYTAQLDKSQGDVSKAQSSLEKARQNANKSEKEVLEMSIKVNRRASQKVIAPIAGFLVQLSANSGTLMVKEGDPICTVVPDTKDRSVQIWLSGNDAPLVEPGRHVRLQFEGWPAVQFTGWPSVAVGTFGGEVISVDATDDGKGRFRIQVLPDPTDDPWPEDRFLRQGVRANGWVLLEQVPLWFEVWRKLNGFPPTVDVDSGSGKSDIKKPKLPK